MSGLVIQKRIAQIRYPWKPIVHSVGGELAQRFFEDYQHGNVLPGTFSFWNDVTFWRAKYDSHMAWISWEVAADGPAFTTRAHRFFKAVTEKLGADSLSRASYRQLSLVPFESFERARDRVMKTVLPIPQGHKEALGGEWADTAIIFEDEGDDGRRLRIGPVRKEEFERKFTELFRHVDQLGAETAVLLDVDVWKAHQDKWARSVLTALLKEAEELTTSTAGMLLEEDA